MRVAQILGDLFRLHHQRAAIGKRGFLAGLRRKLAQFGDGMVQLVAFALGAFDLGAMVHRRHPARRGARPTMLATLAASFSSAAKGVEQAAMGGGIGQRALVVLAVDLDQRLAELLEDLHAHRLVVDEGAGAPVAKVGPGAGSIRRRRRYRLP